MLTPSLVLAYWMCGSMAGLFYAIRAPVAQTEGKRQLYRIMASSSPESTCGLGFALTVREA